MSQDEQIAGLLAQVERLESKVRKLQQKLDSGWRRHWAKEYPLGTRLIDPDCRQLEWRRGEHEERPAFLMYWAGKQSCLHNRIPVERPIVARHIDGSWDVLTPDGKES